MPFGWRAHTAVSDVLAVSTQKLNSLRHIILLNDGLAAAAVDQTESAMAQAQSRMKSPLDRLWAARTRGNPPTRLYARAAPSGTRCTVEPTNRIDTNDFVADR